MKNPKYVRKLVHFDEFRSLGASISYQWIKHARAMYNGMTDDLYRFDPVVVKEGWIFGLNPFPYTAVANQVGVAVIFSKDYEGCTLIGRESNIARFEDFYPKSTSKRQENQTGHGLHVLASGLEANSPRMNAPIEYVKADPEEFGPTAPYYIKAYDQWLSLAKIQHLVAEQNKELRDWSPRKWMPGMMEPEVILKPSTGGADPDFLGGCVWTKATYRTPEGHTFLGFVNKGGGRLELA